MHINHNNTYTIQMHHILIIDIINNTHKPKTETED
jgi:hypothetical protein